MRQQRLLRKFIIAMPYVGGAPTLPADLVGKSVTSML
jgi:hypothetical protein